MSKLTESQRIDLLRFELESIEAGGPEMVDTDTYEVTGDADASWELSLSAKCGEALAEIRRLERDRDALAAHIERYRAAYVNLTNCVEFADNGEGCYVAGGDLMHEFDAIWKASIATSLARRDAAMKAEGAEAIRHLTRGDDWEDDELRQVIEDCAEGFRRQAEGGV